MHSPDITISTTKPISAESLITESIAADAKSPKLKTPQAKVKPLLRGHFHQAAFFISLGACAMLISQSQNLLMFVCTLVYGIALSTLFGVSALYHRPHWNPRARAWMRRADHSAIFINMAGTAAPICLIGMKNEAGYKLFIAILVAAVFGIFKSVFWVKAPKWLSAIVYVGVGSLVIPFLPDVREALGGLGQGLLVTGCIIYAVGAAVYALKKPNPSPKVFGYHEIFHILVIIGAIFHFILIDLLISR